MGALEPLDPVMLGAEPPHADGPVVVHVEGQYIGLSARIAGLFRHGAAAQTHFDHGTGPRGWCGFPWPSSGGAGELHIRVPAIAALAEGVRVIYRATGERADPERFPLMLPHWTLG